MKLIILATLTLIIPFIFGYHFSYNLPNIEQFHEDVLPIIGKKKIEIFTYILANNTKVIMLNILGFLSFGILTCLNTAYNGFIFGLILKIALKNTNSLFVMSTFLPHSIEILGIILSCYLGYRLSIKLKSYIFKDINHFNLKDCKLFLISMIIIILSASIETFITIK